MVGAEGLEPPMTHRPPDLQSGAATRATSHPKKWYLGRESNPHAQRRWFLKPVCIANSTTEALEESVGFEPTDLIKVSGFQDRCDKPDSTNSPLLLHRLSYADSDFIRVEGFEPSTSRIQTEYSAKLSYTLYVRSQSLTRDRDSAITGVNYS